MSEPILPTSNERTASYADLLVMVAQRDTEIERLQKSIDRCGTEEGVCYAVEMERKDKEIERLRAALGSAVLMVNKLKVFGADNVQRYDVEPWLKKVRERFPNLPNAWLFTDDGSVVETRAPISKWPCCPYCGSRLEQTQVGRFKCVSCDILRKSAQETEPKFPEALRDPIKNLERGRELLDNWGPTPITDAALAAESPLARAVRIARGDVGPPTEPVHFAEKASAPLCKCGRRSPHRFVEGECCEVKASGDPIYECCNESCLWRGLESETVHPKHEPSRFLCPECHEVVELV